MRGKFKAFLASLIAAILSAALILPLAACDNEGGGNSGNTVVSVLSMGNKGLDGVKVTATNGGNSTSGTTNGNGNVSLELDRSLNYSVTLDNLPKGYYSAENYSIASTAGQQIKLYVPSKVIETESVGANYVYKTGDVMYDFSFTSTKGASIKLSEELTQKKVVLINFWGSGCGNCQLEFPTLEKVYSKYKDDMSLLALDPPNAYNDTTDAILERTLSNWGLTLSFPYGRDVEEIYKNFYAPAQQGSFSLPISVFIDRYGVVCDIIMGAESDQEKWEQEIERYISEDYVPDINNGQTSDDILNFVPDKPSDFDAEMSDTQDIDRAINKTGTDVLFTADDNEYAWPWVLSSDGQSIVPLGSGHGRSTSIIYADVTIDTNQALLVDYKVSSQETYDLFAIIVDGKGQLGRTTFTDSGNKDWQTALAYIPLSSGSHSIAFVYQKGAIDKKYEDTVYVKNMRLVDATSESVKATDLSYYAARDYDARNHVYETYEEVYLDKNDGYYHIKGRESAGKDPYLLLDITHPVPYTRSTSLYSQFIAENNCLFGDVNYYTQLISYSMVSGNCDIEGTVPVTEELHDILVALCKEDSGAEAFEENPDMWLELCIFYLHYGEMTEESEHYGECAMLKDPALGLAYFSAHEATVTEAYDYELGMQYANRILAAQNALAEANKNQSAIAAAQAELTAAENVYNAYLETFNYTNFDEPIMPRGKVFKFKAPSDGVYHFYAVGGEYDPYYTIEASIYSDGLNLHTALSTPESNFGSDTLLREGDSNLFHLYKYLKQGESCYINVAFDSVETPGYIYFAINNIGAEHKNLQTVAAGYLTTSLDKETLGQIYRPLYTKVEYKSADGYYYDATFGNRILVDFTGYTRFSATHSLEDLLNAVKAGKPVTMPATVDGVATTVNVDFDFTGFSLQLGKETIVGQNYNDLMQAYLEQSKQVGEGDVEYGLVEADKQLRDILLLFTAKYSEVTVEEDWLIFCYYYECYGANY